MTASDRAVEALRRAAADLHLFHPRGPAESCPAESCTRIRAELAELAPSPVDVDDEKYCDAVLLLPHGGKLECHVKGVPHDGDHWVPSDEPCPTCAGMDVHAGWCPLIGEAARSFIDVRFDDAGSYWVGPRP